MKLFCVNIKDIHKDVIEHGYNILNKDEILAVNKFRFEKGRAVKTVSTLIAKYVIKQEFDLDKYILKKNRYGKPYLEDYTDKYFNISHSGDWIICGVSDYELGVDVEEKKEFRDILEIAKRFFSIDESNYLLEINNNDEQLTAFYDIWTKKESFIKAVGQGISLNLGSFSVPINLKENKRIKYDNLCWYFMTSKLEGYYPVSVCEKEFSSNSIQSIELDISALY
jgi:4'-phosphopantetheinyl transferase